MNSTLSQNKILMLIPIIDQSNTRSSNVEERKPILNRCAPDIMQRDAVGDRYRIGIRCVLITEMKCQSLIKC